jgi:hypothetical protein
MAWSTPGWAASWSRSASGLTVAANGADIAPSWRTDKATVWCFCMGFDKHDKDNISPREKKALHKLGDEYMAFRDADLSGMVRDGLIIEVRCNEQNSEKRP